jgi:single-stranded-DNA-specific exonuclease
MIEENQELINAKSTVLYKENWHKGLIGIVAARCIEKYYRPTIIFTKSGDYAAGSARSITGFDIHAAIEQCADYLIQFGGHMYAAGLTIRPENIDHFRKKFDEVVSATISDDMLRPSIEIDLKINLDEVTPKLYNLIRQMAPFGPQNMQPVFVTENVVDTGQSKLLKNNHLKLYIKQQNSNKIVEAIAFNMPQHFERITKKEKFNICFSINENNFNGNKTLQLNIRDIRFV